MDLKKIEKYNGWISDLTPLAEKDKDICEIISLFEQLKQLEENSV